MQKQTNQVRFLLGQTYADPGYNLLGHAIEDWVNPIGYQDWTVQRFALRHHDMMLSPADFTEANRKINGGRKIEFCI